MSLVPRCPVEKPCEAETFEEAFQKNKLRLSFEKQGATEMYRQMVAEKDPKAETLNPEFWGGCEGANYRAFFIYQEELKALRDRVVERINASTNPHGTRSKQYVSGYTDVTSQWTKALKTNDPSMVVYW